LGCSAGLPKHFSPSRRTCSRRVLFSTRQQRKTVQFEPAISPPSASPPCRELASSTNLNGPALSSARASFLDPVKTHWHPRFFRNSRRPEKPPIRSPITSTSNSGWWLASSVTDWDTGWFFGSIDDRCTGWLIFWGTSNFIGIDEKKLNRKSAFVFLASELWWVSAAPFRNGGCRRADCAIACKRQTFCAPNARLSDYRNLMQGPLSAPGRAGRLHEPGPCNLSFFALRCPQGLN
jgi:hypothetical protein